ncbi:acyl-CoA dehydrogenase family protein [Aurantivibrio plasticivorans]
MNINSDQAIRFAQNEINNLNCNEDDFPFDGWKKLAEFGVFALPISEEHSGLGVSCEETCDVLEALGYAMDDQGLLHAACTQILCGIAIDKFGSDEIKAEYLPKICDGSLIMAQALTEPNAGSALGEMATTALLDDSGNYHVKGSKIFTSNGPIATSVLVFCVTHPQRKSFGRISCLIMDPPLQGMNQSKAMKKMGLHSLKNGELFFDDCIVPESKILGKPGAGDAISNSVMSWERTILFATMVGKQQKILEGCIQYANERHQGGQAIAKYQAVSHKIADMKVNHHLSKLVVKDAANAIDSGKNAMLESAICKLVVSEKLKAAALDSVQIRGGYGYMTEYPAEGDVRDSMASTIYSGTSEIQKNIIARLIGL